jgi:hypothetical protein
MVGARHGLACTVCDVCRIESRRGAVIARNEAIANKTKTQDDTGDCGLRRNDGLCCMGDCFVPANDGHG